MNPFKIAYTDSAELPVAGDFGAVVTKGDTQNTLSLPGALKPILESMDVRTPAEFHACVSMAPTFFVRELGWKKEEVGAAHAKLTDTLRGFVPDSILEPRAPKQQTAFGAKPPRP